MIGQGRALEGKEGRVLGEKSGDLAGKAEKPRSQRGDMSPSQVTWGGVDLSLQGGEGRRIRARGLLQGGKGREKSLSLLMKKGRFQATKVPDGPKEQGATTIYGRERGELGGGGGRKKGPSEFLTSS